jgi:hypothetical protein
MSTVEVRAAFTWLKTVPWALSADRSKTIIGYFKLAGATSKKSIPEHINGLIDVFARLERELRKARGIYGGLRVQCPRDSEASNELKMVECFAESREHLAARYSVDLFTLKQNESLTPEQFEPHRDNKRNQKNQLVQQLLVLMNAGEHVYEKLVKGNLQIPATPLERPSRSTGGATVFKWIATLSDVQEATLRAVSPNSIGQSPLASTSTFNCPQSVQDNLNAPFTALKRPASRGVSPNKSAPAKRAATHSPNVQSLLKSEYGTLAPVAAYVRGVSWPPDAPATPSEDTEARQLKRKSA